MEKHKINNMTKGWFIGDFKPTLYKTQDVEVALKEYKKGENEKSHFHKIATEITVIVKGKVRMNENIYSKGDIIIIRPNESTNFEALEDTITSVVKIPGAKNDKYLN